ncbi:hypothetical protein O181_094530 [Austropuccinia psidii MF-1]|uniref:Uncharacterized protein n=1 Tax=Austropuccinia psidii MF-1 TaxID=1389203 RepID=A0A9Q3J3V7_9BASI|nr:hypothetical protein [Austropuccinia psidii MF-1]
MGFKCQSKFFFSFLTHFTSRNHTDLSPLCIEQKQPNSPQQDSPVPSLPHKKNPQQPTPGPSCTQGLEDLFHRKQPKFNLICTFESSELTLPPFVEPSQTNEPPIPGPSTSSKPHEDVPTCEPEPEVAPRQSMEDPFCKSQLHFFLLLQTFTHLSFDHLQLVPLHPTPSSSSMICPSDTPSPAPPPFLCVPPHSHNEARQEFTDLQRTLMTPQAIVHKSINRIFLEQC